MSLLLGGLGKSPEIEMVRAKIEMDFGHVPMVLPSQLTKVAQRLWESMGLGPASAYWMGIAWLLRPTLSGCLPAPINSGEKRTAEGKNGIMTRVLLLVFLHFPASFPCFV